MSITLGQMVDNEINLLGAVSEDEFLGALDAASPTDKRKLYNRVKRSSRASFASGSRGEFERRLALLPPEIRQGLANQTLQAVDSTYYVVKSVEGSKVVKLFRDDDTKVVGMGNISSGKLEKGNYMLLWGIQILAATATYTSGANEKPTINPLAFSGIPDFLRNGELEVKANGTILIPNSSMSIFHTAGKNIDEGLYILDNPKILKDQHPIEVNLEWADNAPKDTYVKVILKGTAVIKA